jgi:hypothetical protein
MEHVLAQKVSAVCWGVMQKRVAPSGTTMPKHKKIIRKSIEMMHTQYANCGMSLSLRPSFASFPFLVSAFPDGPCQPGWYYR